METLIDPYEKLKKKKKKKSHKGDGIEIDDSDHPIHEKYTEMDYSKQKE